MVRSLYASSSVRFDTIHTTHTIRASVRNAILTVVVEEVSSGRSRTAQSLAGNDIGRTAAGISTPSVVLHPSVREGAFARNRL